MDTVKLCIVSLDEYGLSVDIVDTLEYWIKGIYGDLEDVKPESRPVFVDHVPNQLNQVLVIEGKIRIPVPVRTVVEWRWE